MSDVWGAVGGIGSAIAAGGAVGALVYARRTVRVARETLEATAAANAHAVKARAAETIERRQLLTEENQRLRLAQLERVAEIVGRLGDLVEEGGWGSEAARRRGTLVPIAQRQLETALAVLAALGEPELPRCKDVVRMPTDQMRYVNDALAEIAERAGGSPPPSAM